MKIPSPERRLPPQARRSHRERGAGTLEYLGLAVVVSIIIAALAFAPIGSRVATSMGQVICDIVAGLPSGGTCGSGDTPTDEELQPECIMMTNTTTEGSEVDIAFVSLGGDMVMKKVTYSNGEVRISLVDEYTGGLSADLGKVNLGKDFSVNAGAEGNFTYGNGDTWVFDNAEDAAEFEQQAQDYLNSGWNYVPLVGPLFNSAPPSDPRITYDSFELDGNVNAGLGLPPLFKVTETDGDGNTETVASGSAKGPFLPSAGGNVSMSGTVIVQTDRGEDIDDAADDLSTISTAFKVGADGKAGIAGVGAGGNANYSGTMAVTTNADGEITRMVISTTTNADAGGFEDYDDSNPTVVSTVIEPDTPEERAILEAWLADPNSYPPNVEQTMSEVPELTGYDAHDDFTSLMYSQGVVSAQEYDGDRVNNNASYGLKIAGIGLGYTDNTSSNDEILAEAYYYGPPDANGVRPRLTNPKCD